MSLSKENVKYACIAVGAVAASYLAYRYFTSEGEVKPTQPPKTTEDMKKEIF